MENETHFENRLNMEGLHQALSQIKTELAKIIVGQEKTIDLMLTAMLANGHILLEGVPGVAKTMISKLLAKSISTQFSRIQFTPDLMPSDVLGTTIFNSAKAEFEFNPGPIFSNLVLIDEINRAPAKTQAALFEVMEERQVTTDGTCRKVEAPFLVFATQNPIEHEGTYRLPEAQLDRFLFKIDMGYPTLEEEITLLTNTQNREEKDPLSLIEPVVTADQIVRYQDITNKVLVESNLIDYIAKIVEKTRKSNALVLGGSPRASLAILQSAKAFAAIDGRDFVTPEDIIEMISPVLRHRIILTPEKEMEGVKAETIIKHIVDSVEIPR